jgi:isopentenyl-diphosphate delta-isomerase
MQIRDMDHDSIIEMCKRLEFDALAIHLNPGQEMMQDEGDRDFKGILESIAHFKEKAPFPIIVKETGFGIAPFEAKKLKEQGVDYIDTAGMGGTNWIRVEGYRSHEDGSGPSADFNAWGYPTAVLLASYQAMGIQGNILASGGLRNGMDLAKSLALGAHMGGMALPFIKAIKEGGLDQGHRFVEDIKRSLETTLTITNVSSVQELSKRHLFKSSAFKDLQKEIINYSDLID